jgi:uncharacterized protein YidB (DUF937 family)
MGTGKSLPISPEEVTRALGSSDIAGMAAKAGLSSELVSLKLSELLPDAVRSLSPGEKPAGGVISEIGGMLKGKVHM